MTSLLRFSLTGSETTHCVTLVLTRVIEQPAFRWPRLSPVIWSDGFLLRSAEPRRCGAWRVFEKTLEVRSTFDYGSCSLLQIGLYAFEK